MDLPRRPGPHHLASRQLLLVVSDGPGPDVVGSLPATLHLPDALVWLGSALCWLSLWSTRWGHRMPRRLVRHDFGCVTEGVPGRARRGGRQCVKVWGRHLIHRGPESNRKVEEEVSALHCPTPTLVLPAFSKPEPRSPRVPCFVQDAGALPPTPRLASILTKCDFCDSQSLVPLFPLPPSSR